MDRQTLYLCTGTQSSGSTLISWCFLQRHDMDGVLDARFDHLPSLPQNLSAPLPWVKFTIACFRFSEVRAHFEDEGWTVRPLLVVRDVRSVFNSLIQKKYGRNGITADDPPIRLRLRRFLEDWKLFVDRGWPLLRYEDFTNDPISVLRATCAELQVAWDEAMASWPKKLEQIADPGFGNETFVLSRGSSLQETVKPSLASVKTEHIPPGDLEWMEREFAEMNRRMNYPEHVPATADPALGQRAVPQFENTRRYERLRRKHRFSRFFTGASETLGNWMKGGAEES
ncbi:MAG TPA: hypothetical protein VK797_11170 [Tepidisphaeraceae bacterium]|jgi:hypothetical protein|nr:hypothetical protein [Tepidisphaeraceae bacterium]